MKNAILALIALASVCFGSSTPFDTGTHPTAYYVNDPLYIHVPSYGFGIPVAPTNAVAYKLTSDYTISNAHLVINNPFPYPIESVSMIRNFVSQYQGVPGVQYPICGGIGTSGGETRLIHVPAGGSVVVPLINGTYGPFDDIWGEDIGVCGNGSGNPTSMIPFQTPTPGYEPNRAIYFCPMAEVRIGEVTFMTPNGRRTFDFGWNVQTSLVSMHMDVRATGECRLYDANGVEL